MGDKFQFNHSNFLSFRFRMHRILQYSLKILHELESIERFSLVVINSFVCYFIIKDIPIIRGELLDTFRRTSEIVFASLQITFVFFLPFKNLFRINPLSGMPSIPLQMAINAIYGSNPLLEIRRFNTDDINGQVEILAGLWALGFLVFAHDTIDNRCLIFYEWAIKNPDMFRIIYFNNVPVGYYVIMPMSHSIKNEHYTGEIPITAVKSEHILPKGCKSDVLHLQCLYILKSYRTKKAIMALVVKDMLETISDFIPYNHDGSGQFKEVMLYSECFTEEGTELLETLGFVKTSRRSALKYSFAELKMPRKIMPGAMRNYSGFRTIEHLRKLVITRNSGLTTNNKSGVS